MIEIKNLYHSLGTKSVLENVNITVKESTITGLVGINGAGKTTLLRLISGIYTPDKGTIFYKGYPVDRPDVKEKIFFLPDDPFYNHSTTGAELFKMYKSLYPSADHAVFMKNVELFGIDVKARVRTFSKGMRRQLFVALALSIKPELLLLDESFDGLDPLARLNFKKAVNSIVEENGTSVIIASHSLRELEDFCDKYIMIDAKTVHSSGEITEKVERYCKFQLAFTEEQNAETYKELSPISLEINGKFVRIVLEGTREENEPKLLAFNPVVMEEMRMDFEEVFISEAGRKENK